jgi:hypothetical protein
MTTELAVAVILGLLVALARIQAWRACRTPLGRVNYEMAQVRARRRKP